jgi:shikimate kinase
MECTPNIILLGFMGSGKTTTGKELAQLLNFRHWDMDLWIEEKNNMPISQIFESMGESYFRGEEIKALEWIRPQKRFVISLGGGAWLNQALRDSFLKIGWCVWLEVSSAQSFKRVESHISKRPLLAKKENLMEIIEQLLIQRTHLYSLAHATINTDQKTPKEVAQEIMGMLLKLKPFDLPNLT